MSWPQRHAQTGSMLTPEGVGFRVQGLWKNMIIIEYLDH